MKADETLVAKLLEGSDKFIIPVYQRNYEWSKSHIEQFLTDIENTMLKLRKDKDYKYFIGSIVTFSDSGTQNLLLIDGQQRTTTICLILLALRDLLDDKNLTSVDESLREQISDRLINKYDKTENRLKLKPINKDLDIYQSLVFKKDLNENYKNSNVYNNYSLIRRKIHELCNAGEFTIDNFWTALIRLEFVWIKLEYGKDNPQKIFESLNATGKKLEEGDLIRNYVLMNVHPDNQNAYYLKYWREIEENCQGQKLTEFLRYYLMLVNKKYIADKDVYSEFKLTHPEFNENILDKIKKLSNVFKKIKNGAYDRELKNDCLYILDFLKFGTSLSLQMQIMALYEDDLLSKPQVNDCLSLLESYFVRRKICGFPTNGFNKIMPMIVKNLDDKIDDAYVTVFKNNLTEAKNRFPTDKNFEDHLKNFDLYNTKDFCQYFLSKIEKNFNRELLTSLSNLIHNDKVVTKEHIFPQNPSIKWKQTLSDEEYSYFKEEKLHSLGNITLTGYNQDLSNKPWAEKREIFIQSSYTTLNNMLKSYEKWDKQSLLEREDVLVKKALDTWKRPLDNNTDIIETKSNLITIHDNPTGTTPHILSWQGKDITVESWVDVFTKIIETIYDNNPERFQRLAQQGEFGRIISLNELSIHKAYNINDIIFLELHQSPESMFRNLLRIIECFDEFSLDDLLIEVTIDSQIAA